MARQKTKKTALKRFRKTNPKGNRKAKVLHSESRNHHLRTKRSAISKRRKLPREVVANENQKRVKQLLNV